jgi:hypothetical protein
MKIRALRYGSIAALLCACTWAVCGADDITGRRTTSSLNLRKPAKPDALTIAVAAQDAEKRPTAPTTVPISTRPLTLAPRATAPTATSPRTTPLPTSPIVQPRTAVPSSPIAQSNPIAPTVPITPRSPTTTVPVAATTSAPASTPVAPLAPHSPAAESGSTLPAPQVQLSLSTLAPTPEMWFYERMRQDYDNPALQARLRGERAAAERRARLAARAWYGVSVGRPMAHVTPFTYYYSPFWASNTVNPYIWTQPRTVPIIIEARRPTIGVSGFGAW